MPPRSVTRTHQFVHRVGSSHHRPFVARTGARGAGNSGCPDAIQSGVLSEDSSLEDNRTRSLPLGLTGLRKARPFSMSRYPVGVVTRPEGPRSRRNSTMVLRRDFSAVFGGSAPRSRRCGRSTGRGRRGSPTHRAQPARAANPQGQRAFHQSCRSHEDSSRPQVCDANGRCSIRVAGPGTVTGSLTGTDLLTITGLDAGADVQATRSHHSPAASRGAVPAHSSAG